MATDNPILPAGTQLQVVSAGTPCRVGEFLGGGGQGNVYRAEVGGSEFALKWYHPRIVGDVGLQRRIRQAVRRDPPDARFLWPRAIVTDATRQNFGYLMALRPPAYREIKQVLARPPAPSLPLTLRERAHVGLQIAAGFLQLHASGFCYQDINFGAFFVDPATHGVLICDNDNVDVDGAAPAGIGTPKFMAPEIVRREAGSSTNTDLYSLSVALFWLLLGVHPLEGRAAYAIVMMTQEDEDELYGRTPLFIFDPRDDRNAVEPEQKFQIALWQALPAALRVLFVRAFGEGLHHPHRRVIETEWISALATVRDQALPCAGPDCGFESVPARSRSTAPAAAGCHWCGNALAHPPALHIGRITLTIVPGARVFGSHLSRAASGPHDHAIGKVVVNDKGQMGLRNLSQASWRASDDTGRESEVKPGKAVGLWPGVRIAFGSVTAEVTA